MSFITETSHRFSSTTNRCGKYDSRLMPVEILMRIYNIFNTIITKATDINYNEIIKNNNCPFEILGMINKCK